MEQNYNMDCKIQEKLWILAHSELRQTQPPHLSSLH